MVKPFPPELYLSESKIYVGIFPHDGDVEKHNHVFYELVFFDYGLFNHHWEGKRRILTRGDLFCIRPGEAHQYTRSKDAKLFNCLFYLEALPSGLEKIKGVKELLFGEQRQHLHVPVALQQEFTSILLKMMRELTEQATGYEEILSLQLGELLILAGRVFLASTKKERAYSPQGKLKEALAYLEKNFSKPLQIDEVAKAHGLSPDQFSRLSRKLLGIPPSRYLQNIRLGNAMELLLDEELPIAEIAAEVGFDSQNYFARLFRRITGQSPTEFRAEKGL